MLELVLKELEIYLNKPNKQLLQLFLLIKSMQSAKRDLQDLEEVMMSEIIL
jgi:hypothetical protein